MSLPKVNIPNMGMEEATKKVIESLGKNATGIQGEKQESAPADKVESQVDVKGQTIDKTGDLQALQTGIDKYSSINEHGKGVWIVGDVKKRIDELNYRTGRKVSIRAFTNAALEFVLDKYGNEIVEMFGNR